MEDRRLLFDSYPRLILKENRKVLSMEDTRLWIKIARDQGKLCLFSLYAFERWKNREPILDSVILDVFALKGERGNLEKLAEEYFKEGKQSLFMFDGQDYLLIVEHDGTPLKTIKIPKDTELITDLLFKFTYPKTRNGRTGKLSEIIRRYKK